MRLSHDAARITLTQLVSSADAEVVDEDQRVIGKHYRSTFPRMRDAVAGAVVLAEDESVRGMTVHSDTPYIVPVLLCSRTFMILTVTCRTASSCIIYSLEDPGHSLTDWSGIE
jgi:hypothetical protein